jgi:UDP-glucose 4-epimerase
MKRILVTGGAGFIGSHSVDLLLQQDKQVCVYDNFSAGKLSYLNAFHPKLRIVQGDILDYGLLAKEISLCDAVLHLAALPSVPKSIEDPVVSMRVNTQGFLHVLQAVRETQRPIRVVYASSAAVYGDAVDLPCNDETQLSGNYLSPYALEKANDEQYASLYARLFGIKTLGLRYFNVYGLRQDPASPYSGVISRFISLYKAREMITVFGNGKQSRDFIHVSDVARANCLALESDITGVMNVATGAPETLLNLLHYIETAGNHKAEITFAETRTGDIRESYAAVAKAKNKLQFSYEIGLKQGIAELVSH